MNLLNCFRRKVVTSRLESKNFINVIDRFMQSGWVKIVFTVIILVIQVNVFYGQTGPGGVGTSSNNILWLRADERKELK